MTTAPAETAETKRTLLETWADNERMRHVPAIGWMIRKLDVDLRARIDILFEPMAALPTDDPRWNDLDVRFRALCRALDRLAEVARRGNSHAQHPPNELRARIRWGLDHAVANLQSVDASLFGRRYPFHTGERSKAEPLYAALLVVLYDVDRILTSAREVDHGVDERLLSGLVVLEHPLPSGPMVKQADDGADRTDQV
jgi:hypothetical protein